METIQIKAECKSDSFKMVSCSTDVKHSNDCRTLKTEQQFDLDDFQTYLISEECELIFNLRDMRKILAFADSVGAVLTVKFNGPGSALIFECCAFDNVCIDFVVATVLDPTWKPKGPQNLESNTQTTSLKDYELLEDDDNDDDDVLPSTPDRDVEIPSLFRQLAAVVWETDFSPVPAASHDQQQTRLNQ